jgi:hypothetical protein
MWQFTDHATVPGISTPADGNRFNGTADQLWALGKPGDLPVDDPYAAWSGLVGSGLLELLAQDNALPAQSRSTWLPLGSTPADVEEVYGDNGTRYTWLLGPNVGLRFRPD